MRIRTRYIDNIAVIDVEGKININSSKLIESVGSILEKGICKIIINMQDIDFVDYNGLSVLAIAYKSALNNKAILKLSNISPHILELLRVVRLDEVFEIYNNLEDALAAFKHKTEKAKEEILEQPFRRRFTRLYIDMPVSYKLIRGGPHMGGEGLYSGRIANISGAGIFIRTINLLSPGSEIDMEVKLGKLTNLKHLKGVVMWLADKDLQPDLYPGMSAQFIELSQHNQEEIIGFVEKHVVHRKG